MGVSISSKKLKVPKQNNPRFHGLEHKSLKHFRGMGFANKNLVVCVSGGRDSVLTYVLLKRLQPILKYKIIPVHIHHGDGNKKQVAYRDRSLRFVKKLVAGYGDILLTNDLLRPQKKLSSEGEFREFRWAAIQEILVQQGVGYQNSVLVTGHHGDDWLETQLLCWIRGGSGIEHLRKTEIGPGALKNWEFFRPIFLWAGAELATYGKYLKQKWIQDPSNASHEPLRNWLRQNWLPQLEKKREGSVESFKHSLLVLSEKIQEKSMGPSGFRFSADQISRLEFMALNTSDKKEMIHQFLRHLGISGFTTNHIEEIVKRLCVRRKVFTFLVLKHHWAVGPATVAVSPSQRARF
jgi:tRNA(Ile)-lysidine synthetase-like protein